MPTYIDVIKFEEEAPANTIRLVKSGEFYRAYNHSAWLFQCCITEHKVMRKYIKSLKTDIYYIGFPEKSLFNNICIVQGFKFEQEETERLCDVMNVTDEERELLMSYYD